VSLIPSIDVSQELIVMNDGKLKLGTIQDKSTIQVIPALNQD
jgi:hypothetical protein